MPSNFVVFAEKPTSYRVVDGLVYAEDVSGKVTFQRVMSIATFKQSVLLAHEALAQWEYDQIPEGDKPGAPIPFRKR